MSHTIQKINGVTFEQRNGKYYINGNPIDKRLVVKKANSPTIFLAGFTCGFLAALLVWGFV